MADIVKRFDCPATQDHQIYFDFKNDATNLRRKFFRSNNLPEPGRSSLPRATETDEKQSDKASRELHAEDSRSLDREAFWAVDTTLSWIAFKHPDRLLDDWRIPTWYQGKPRSQQMLLHALQEGKLTAFDRNRAVIPAEFWAYVPERDLPQLDVRIRRSQVKALWPADDGLAASKKARGRPPKTDDNLLRAEVFKLMDHHGEFAAGDPDWNAQAKLEAEIAEKCSLSTSRARVRIKMPLEEWRHQKRLVNSA